MAQYRPPESRHTNYVPAPYGGACAGCARAKCKCYYLMGSNECERCMRLSKVCEPSTKTRKRKAPISPLNPPTRGSQSLAAKLDDIMALLRAQNSEKDSEMTSQAPSLARSEGSPSTPHVLSASDAVRDAGSGAQPDLLLNTADGYVNMIRPKISMQDRSSESATASLRIEMDVSVHSLSGEDDMLHLETFRESFLPKFPFVYIPLGTQPADFRRQKPFTWLVITALTDRSAAKQFEMEETIWAIISKRIVCEHYESIDLVLGLVAFSAWSHYFKEDKPFMNKITQLATSLTHDLEIHKSSSAHWQRQRKTRNTVSQEPQRTYQRSMEERRTFVAVFHLSSVTWETYRKIRPLNWSPYLNDCLRTLREHPESDFDLLLVGQVECQLIANRLTCPVIDHLGHTESANIPSRTLAAAMLKELGDIQQNLQQHIKSNKMMRLILGSTELKIRDYELKCGSRNNLQRLQDLENTMTCIERCIGMSPKMTVVDWLGVSVDTFNQFTQWLVILFKLTTLEEPGWDVDQVKDRVNVFQVLDEHCEIMKQVAQKTNMLDTSGPRHGLFFKVPHLLRAIKALMVAEMNGQEAASVCENQHTSCDVGNQGANIAEELGFGDVLYLSLDTEPWLADVFDETWNFGPF